MSLELQAIEKKLEEAKKELEAYRKKQEAPVLKSGQVWDYYGVCILIESAGLGEGNRGKWYASDLTGRLVDGPAKSPEDLCLGRNWQPTGKNAKLLANSIEEYYRKVIFK